MTPQPSAADSAIPDNVRQKLDELDAFLQGMLGLPVQPGEENPNVFEHTESQLKIEPPPTIPTPVSEVPPIERTEAICESTTAKQIGQPVSAPVKTSAAREFARNIESESEPDRIEHGERSSVPIWLWPVVALNRAAESPTYLLGARGPSLRESLRTSAGWMGVGLIVLSALWVLIDWLIWKW